MAQSSISKVREVLSQKNLSPLKQLGQNFLVDENITAAIARAAEPQDQNIIEVGPGLGALTEKLAKDAKTLVAVEIDRGIFGYLKETFGTEENIVLVNEDILKTDVEALYKTYFKKGEVVLAANLPYYITSAVIMHFLEADIPLSHMVVMVQKEVAERLCAGPGDKTYGALTAMVQYFGKPELVMKVSPGCFYPRPEVESAVVRIRVENKADQTSQKYIRFVKACFAMKRKTLVNNLIKAGYEKNAILAALEAENIDEMARAETLSTKKLFALTNSLTR